MKSGSSRQATRVTLGLPVVIGIVAVVVVALASWFLACERRIAGEWGYALDDSWIYATMARNLATGHGFSFNPGEPVAGATGPLYTLFLSLFYLLFRDVVWPAKIFGVACQVAAGACVYLAALSLLPGRRLLSLMAALLVVTSPPLVWGMLSGMEIPLYLLCLTGGLAMLLRGRAVWAVAIWSAGVWVRPDGLFLVALGILASPREAWRGLLAAAPILLAYFAFNHAIGGQWMPQTVGVKAHFGLDLAGRTWGMMREWGTLWGIPYRPEDMLEAPVVFLPLLLVGAALTWRRYPILAAYAVGLPLVLSLFRGDSGPHKRYILYVVPCVALLSVTALDWLGQRYSKRLPHYFAAAAAAACLLVQGFFLPAKAENYGWNVQNINKMQVLLGKFVKLATQPGDVVAANDIGAIGYFGERRVVDLMGLVSPLRPLPENLARYDPKLLLVFVTWFKPYARDDPKSGNYLFWDADSTNRYELLAGIELRRNTICASNRMTAYVRLGPGDPSPAQRFLYEF